MWGRGADATAQKNCDHRKNRPKPEGPIQPSRSSVGRARGVKKGGGRGDLVGREFNLFCKW